MHTRITISLLLLCACLPACGGGGGGGGDEGYLVTQMVGPTPSRTGSVYSNGIVTVGADLMIVGDNFENTTSRAFISFPLLALPAPEDIVSVVYEDAQTSVTGTPYASLGDLVVVDTQLGPSLDASDFTGPAVSVALGSLSSTPGEGVRTLDLTAWTISRLESGADRLDLMLTFEVATDADSQTDAVWLRSSTHEDGTGRLLVRHRVVPAP